MRARRLGALLLLVLAGGGGAWAGTCSVARTRHFLFLYEPRDRAAVDELLTFSEDVYARVTDFFDWRPDTVPVVIRGWHDDANGATYSTPPRIELYLTADMTQEFGPLTESWLRMLLTHELTHFVHQSMDTGFLHAVSLVLGPAASAWSLAYLPYWAVEGPAVYDETLFTTGGRGRSPLFEIYSKAPIEENNLFSLDQAGYSSTFPPSGRQYVAGWMLVDWLQSSYGPATLRRIMDAYLDFPFLGPWDAIRSVTGKDAATVFAEMRNGLRARYSADSGIRGGARVSPKRIGSWRHPQATRRGLYVYRTGPDALSAIVRLDAVTGRDDVLVEAPLTDPSSFSATPDGLRVVFSTLRVDDSRPAEERTTADLFSLDVERRAVRRMTRNAHLWQPALSAQGDVILAVQGVGPYSRLVRVDPGTGAVRVLYSRREGNVYTPVISPDGRAVAFVFNLRGVQCVYVAEIAALDAGSVPVTESESAPADVNTAAVHPVVGPDPFGSYSPSFMDGHTLLFSSDRSGALALYESDLDTGRITLVQRDPVAALSGVVDGTTLFYAGYESTGFCVKSVPLADLRPEAVDAAPSVPFPDPQPWTGSAVPSRPFLDLPWPYLWFPEASLLEGPGTLDIGFGAAVYGGSLLGAATWSASAGWLVGSSQPTVDVSIETSLGQVTLGLTGALDYAWDGSWRDSVDTLFSATWTALSDYQLDTVSYVGVGAGVLYAVATASASPFTFQDALAAGAGAWSSTVAVPFVVAGDWHRAQSRIELNPVLGLSGRVQATTYLPVLSLATTAEVVDATAALTVPSLVPHQALKLGVKAEADVAGLSAPYTDSTTVPRGFPSARSRNAECGLLASIDYLAPVALLDQPLMLGFAVTALGVSLHAEAVADAGLSAPSFTVMPTLYVGGDATIRVAFNGLSFPLGIGLAAALTPGAAFDPARDLGVYLFTGFDSFGSSGRSAVPSLHPSSTACYTSGDAG